MGITYSGLDGSSPTSLGSPSPALQGDGSYKVPMGVTVTYDEYPDFDWGVYAPFSGQVFPLLADSTSHKPGTTGYTETLGSAFDGAMDVTFSSESGNTLFINDFVITATIAADTVNFPTLTIDGVTCVCVKFVYHLYFNDHGNPYLVDVVDYIKFGSGSLGR